MSVHPRSPAVRGSVTLGAVGDDGDDDGDVFEVEARDDFKNPLAATTQTTHDNTAGDSSTAEMDAEILLERKRIQQVFDSIDLDGSGRLDRSELSKASLQLGRRLTDIDVAVAMEEMDADGGGDIDFDEFFEWWQKQQISMTVLPECLTSELTAAEVDHRTWGVKIDTTNEIEMQKEEEEMAQTILLAKMQEENMISPVSPFRRKWDAVQAVLLIYIAVIVPYRIGFDDDTKPFEFFFCLDMLIDIYFLLDLGLNFRTAVYSFDGDLIHEPRQVAKIYLKGWFPLDFMACLPVNYIVYLPGVASEGDQGDEAASLRGNKIMRLLRLARLLKILRLLRFKRLLERWEEQLYSKGLFTFAKLLMLIFGLGHWMASAWYYFGVGEEKDKFNPDGTHVKGWAVVAFEDKAEGASQVTRYIWSFYWALMTLTTVGYGDISPNTNGEKVFVCFSMVVGGFVFGIIVGSASDMIRQQNPGDNARNQALGLIHGFLHERKIPAGLTRRVRAFYSHFFKERGITGSELEVFRRLPDEMRNELALQLNYLDGSHSLGVLHKVPFFKGLSSWELTQVCTLLTPLRCTRADVGEDGSASRYIMKEGEHGSEMFVVKEGTVSIRTNAVGDLGVLREGDFFGELALLLQPPVGNEHGHGVMRQRSAVALTNVEVLILHAHDLNALRTQCPGLDSVVAKAAMDTAKRNPSLLSLVDELDEEEGRPPPLSNIMRWRSLQGAIELQRIKMEEGEHLRRQETAELRVQLERIEKLLTK